MRMFPEEKKSGTYELLLTSPVRVSEIVLGKFLGGLVLVMLMVALSGFFGLLLLAYGNPELPMMLDGLPRAGCSGDLVPRDRHADLVVHRQLVIAYVGRALRAPGALHHRLARRDRTGRPRARSSSTCRSPTTSRSS